MGFELGDVTPFLALGGVGLALFFVLRSVRFVDARTKNALEATQVRNGELLQQVQAAETEADLERRERIKSEETAGRAQAQVEGLTQRVADLTDEVARLRAEIQELRQEMHSDPN